MFKRNITGRLFLSFGDKTKNPNSSINLFRNKAKKYLSQMNMYNFNNTGQADFYDATRPQYTQQILQYVLDSVKNKENFLDVACGTGQVIWNLTIVNIPTFEKF